MTRLARHRTRSFSDPGGTYKQYANGVLSYTNINGIKPWSGTCDDSHGSPVVDSAFNSSQRTQSVAPVSGSAISGVYEGVAVGYYLTYPALITASHLVLPSLPAASADALGALARTNPSRPEVTPLSLLQDLIDIPKQLRDVGRLIKSPKRILNSKEIANQYLGVKFGWLPLIQDVQDLMDLGIHIHRRVGEIHKLYSSNGLKRRISLANQNAVDVQRNVSFESNVSLTAHGDVFKTTSQKRWATVRWLPTTLPKYNPTDLEVLQLAKRISLGLTLDGLGKGAWDLIPWSFVVNWFTNVGQYGLSHSNAIPASPSVVNVMTETRTEFLYSVTSMTSGYTGGGGSSTLTDKVRYVGSGAVSANIPFIGSDRLSILSALFVQRFKR